MNFARRALVLIVFLVAPFAAGQGAKKVDTHVVMPAMARGQSEGVISRWLKNEGDLVDRDEPLVEISTETVDAELTSPAAGVLKRIYADNGATVRVGTVIAIVGEPDGTQPRKRRVLRETRSDDGIDFLSGSKLQATVTFDTTTDPVVKCADEKMKTGAQMFQALGSCWEETIRARLPSRTPAWARRFNVVIVDKAAGVLYTSDEPYIAGNPIFVGVFSPASHSWALPVFDPCGLQSATPEILGGTLPKTSVTKSIVDIPQFSFVRFGPQRCFDVDVTVKLKGTAPDPTDGTKTVAVNGEFKIKQYKRYRGSVQLGALYTDRREHSFGLRNEGTNKVVFDKGLEGSSQEYVAALVLHGLIHYFPRRGAPSYGGRDPLHETGLSDRLGLLLAASLTSPQKRFGVGLSYELLYGFNVIGVYELARVKELSGVKVGDVFAGAETELPLRETTQRGWTIGITFDPAFATSLFGGN